MEKDNYVSIYKVYLCNNSMPYEGCKYFAVGRIKGECKSWTRISGRLTCTNALAIAECEATNEN